MGDRRSARSRAPGRRLDHAPPDDLHPSLHGQPVCSVEQLGSTRVRSCARVVRRFRSEAERRRGAERPLADPPRLFAFRRGERRGGVARRLFVDGEPVAGGPRFVPRCDLPNRSTCAVAGSRRTRGPSRSRGGRARIRRDSPPPQGAGARTGAGARAGRRSHVRSSRRWSSSRTPAARTAPRTVGGRSSSWPRCSTSITPSSLELRGRSHGRRTIRRSSRRAALPFASAGPSTRTGTVVGTRARLRRLVRPAASVDTHELAGLPLRHPADGPRPTRPRRRGDRPGTRGRGDRARPADERAGARSARSDRSRRARPLAQHHGRRLRADQANDAPTHRRGRDHRARRLLRRSLRTASAGHACIRAEARAPPAGRPPSRAGTESVDADVPRRHAHLRRARAREVDAPARRDRQWIDPARERPRDSSRRRARPHADDLRLEAGGHPSARRAAGAVERRGRPLLGSPRQGRGGRVHAGPDSEAPVTASTAVSTPVVFLVLGLLVFALLAAHERFSGRIALPRTDPTVGDVR